MGKPVTGRGGLSPQVVAQIERLLEREEGLTNVQIANRTGVGVESVRKIRHGIYRTQLGPDRRSRYPDSVIREIEELLLAGATLAAVAQQFGMSRNTVRLIYNGEHHVHLVKRGLR